MRAASGVRWDVLCVLTLFIFAIKAVADTRLLQTRVGLESNQGFCSGGVYPGTSLPDTSPAGLKIWGSFCGRGDANIGTAVTEPFPAPEYLSLYLAGYPSATGVALRLESVSGHASIPIRSGVTPGEMWLLCDFAVPAAWRGQLVRLTAQDQSVSPGGWVAFSEPLAGTPPSAAREGGSLFARVVLHFLLTMVPALAICAFAISRGVRDLVDAGLVLLAGVAVPGYVVFWLVLGQRHLGYDLGFLIPILSAILLIFVVSKLDNAGRRILRSLLIPVGLIGAASSLVLATGFLYGGMDRSLQTASRRFSHLLPPDNVIPFVFAQDVHSGSIRKPLFGDWSLSDRPPLQAGVTLAQQAYSTQPQELSYTVLSVVLQSTWILGLWLFLSAQRVEPRAIVLVLLACLFTGFTFVNTFFVWPKLLSAAFALGFLALFLTDRLRERSGQARFLSVIAGALLALAMLSHGGSAFAFLGALATVISLKKRFAPGNIVCLVLSSALIYLPWFLYQKFVDPPGDRLLKWHLAGVVSVDHRSFAKALRDAYGGLTFHQILANKLSNAQMVIGSTANYWQGLADLLKSLVSRRSIDLALIGDAAYNLRGTMFFFFIPFLGFLALGPIALLFSLRKNLRSQTMKAAATCWVFVVLTLAIFCLLMFGPDSTVIHQGAYIVELLAMSGSVLALWAISPLLAILIASLQILLNLTLYGVLMRLPPQPVLPDANWLRPPLLVLSILSLLLVLFLSGLLARQQRDFLKSPQTG